ncbi:MAG TPA: hypothetical protein VGK48_10495 [Terriglobia bacterium]
MSGAFRQFLAHEDADGLHTLLAIPQVFDFSGLEDRFLLDDLVQFAIVDMAGFHAPPQGEVQHAFPSRNINESSRRDARGVEVFQGQAAGSFRPDGDGGRSKGWFKNT